MLNPYQPPRHDNENYSDDFFWIIALGIIAGPSLITAYIFSKTFCKNNFLVFYITYCIFQVAYGIFIGNVLGNIISSTTW